MTKTLHGTTPRFGRAATKLDKRNAGQTSASATPFELHMHHVYIGPELRSWIEERAGRQLGKFAPCIERLMVLFGDENGSKGGIDAHCTIHVALSALPHVVTQGRAASPREAFDQAMARAERSTRRSLEKHGFSASRVTVSTKRPSVPQAGLALARAPSREGRGAAEGRAPGSTIGRRVGHAWQNVIDTRSAKGRRPRHGVDTQEPGTSETDRKAGAGNTAARNTKLNTRGMTHMLEDSAQERPSRKSSRKSVGRTKSATPLERRTRRELVSPEARAARNSVRR